MQEGGRAGSGLVPLLPFVAELSASLLYLSPRLLPARWSPQRNGADQNKIVITGYEDKCAVVRDRILARVKEMEEQEHADSGSVSETISIEPQAHGRIIGARGKQVAQLSDRLGVLIRFPKVGAVCSLRTHVLRSRPNRWTLR